MSFFEPANTTYPYFHVTRGATNAALSTVNQDNPFPFDTVIANNGSGYSTSTGIFTVPAGRPGVYYFTLSVGLGNSAAAMGTSSVRGFFGFKAIVSGATRYYTISDISLTYNTSTAVEISISSGILVQLSPGDTVMPYYVFTTRQLNLQGTNVIGSNTYYRSSASGCLVCATY